MGASFKVAGLRELTARMTQLPLKLQRRGLQNAMRAGARVVVTEVKREVVAHGLIDSGALLRNVATRGSRGGRQNLVARQIIGVRSGRADLRAKRLSGYAKRQQRTGENPFYYRFQEEGYHAVGRRSRASKSERRRRQHGRASYGRFIPGKHFLRDGLARATPRALAAITQRLAAELARL